MCIYIYIVYIYICIYMPVSFWFSAMIYQIVLLLCFDSQRFVQEQGVYTAEMTFRWEHIDMLAILSITTTAVPASEKL